MNHAVQPPQGNSSPSTSATCLNLLERITRRYAPKVSEEIRKVGLTPAERESLFARGAMKLVPPGPPGPSKYSRYRYTGKFRPLDKNITAAAKDLMSMGDLPHGFIKRYCDERGLKYSSVFCRYRGLYLARKMAQEKVA